MRGDDQVVLMIALMILGLVLGIIAGDSFSNANAQAIITGAVALASAYAGARFAFGFSKDEAERERQEACVREVNLAIHKLVRAHHQMNVLHRQYIKPFENNPLRHLLIKPSVGADWADPQFNYEGLSFLFQSKEPNCLNELLLLEMELASLFGTVRTRNEVHNELQPVLTAIFGNDANEIDSDTFLSKIPLHLNRQLLDCMDGIIEDLRPAVSSVEIMTAKLRKLTREIFPDHPNGIVSFQPVNIFVDEPAPRDAPALEGH